MSARLHRQDARRLLIGIVAIAAGGVIAYVGTLVQGGGALPLKDHTEVSAYFDDVGTLKPQQNVTQNGIRIGVVTNISYKNDQALVKMRLDGDRELYADATAAVGNASVLGRKFVSLDPGTASSGLLGGKPIAAQKTTSSADLNTVLSALPPKARVGLQTGLREVGGGVSGHQKDLYSALQVAPGMMDDATLVLDTVAAPKTDLDGLLVTGDSLVSHIHGHERQIQTLVTTTNTTLGAVNTNDTEPLRRTVADAPKTLVTARQGLAEINPALDDTADAVTELRPGVDDLVESVPNLREFLVEAPPVAVTVRDFAEGSAEPVGTLVPAVTKAEPTVGRVRKTLGKTAPTLEVLSPYAPDAGTLFCENDLLSGNYGPGKHYFSAMLVFPGVYVASQPDPLANVDPYSGPGKAFSHGLKYGKGKC